MNSRKPPILSVPTNMITGFLGVGKTTAILNLMAHKPDNERWAVLVNEFGEIGVDGILVKGGEAMFSKCSSVKFRVAVCAALLDYPCKLRLINC